jgi:hypothetical protein
MHIIFTALAQNPKKILVDETKCLNLQPDKPQQQEERHPGHMRTHELVLYIILNSMECTIQYEI